MHDVATLLGAAAVAHLLARTWGVPPTPLLLIAGLAAARTLHLTDAFLEDAVVLGASFLLFTGGMELSGRRVGRQASAAFRVGTSQFVALGLLGFLAGGALGYEPLEAAYLALALTASSTLVGIRLLKRRRQMFEPFGRLVLGVLLLQDLLVLIAIPIVLALAMGNRAGWTGAAGVALLAALTWAARRWVGPQLARVEDEPELVLLAALTLLFAFLGIGAWMGIPLVVGAFLAGVALSSFPVDGMVRSVVTPISDFFAAIFFTALGALVVTPTLPQIAQAALLAVGVILVTVPLVTVLAIRSGLSTRPAVEAGLMLAQTSELSLALGLTGMLAGHIRPEVFTVIALVTVGTMLLTPVLSTDRVALGLAHRIPQRSPGEASSLQDHVLVLGAGSTGSLLLEDLILADCRLVVVDDDPSLAARVREAGIQVVRGNASDPRVLAAAGAGEARLIISTLHHPRDVETLLEMVDDVPVLVRVFDEPEAEWMRARGGEPVLFHEASAHGLLEWTREESAELDQSLRDRLPAAPEGDPPRDGAPQPASAG
jgi:CPA2 family monovalent cation:H+ antiporter-2